MITNEEQTDKKNETLKTTIILTGEVFADGDDEYPYYTSQAYLNGNEDMLVDIRWDIIYGDEDDALEASDQIDDWDKPSYVRDLNTGNEISDYDLFFEHDTDKINDYLYKLMSQKVDILINSGSDIDIEDENDNTLLMTVSQKGYSKLAALLIDAGANVNYQDDYKYTPLIMAVTNNSDEISEILINAGADYNFKDKNGLSSWDHVKQKGNTRLTSLIENYDLMKDVDKQEEIEIKSLGSTPDPVKTFANRSALELQKLQTRDIERESDLSPGL